MNFDTTRLTYIGNGTSLRINAIACNGCGTCIDICPHAVIDLSQRKALVTARERCMECGACQMNCPAQAIEVMRGVGCVAALVNGMLNKTGATCGCSTNESPSSCC